MSEILKAFQVIKVYTSESVGSGAFQVIKVLTPTGSGDAPFNVIKVFTFGPQGIQGEVGPPGTTTWGGITDKPETFPPDAHTHTFDSLTEKPLTFPPDAHTHTFDSLTEKPLTFPPDAHTHTFDSLTEKPLTFPPDAHTHTFDSLTDKPETYTPSAHTHDAADVVSGVFDVARIPVLPSQIQIMSSGGIADLTGGQQTQIGQGTVVTTTDGRRWVYTGTGDKLLEASYVILADISPEWDAVANKPSFFATTAALISDATTAGRNFLTAATVSAQKVLLALVIGDIDGLVDALAGKSNTGHAHVIADTTGLQAELDNPTPNSVAFDLAPTGSPAVGRLAWNADDETLDLPLNAAVTLQIGQETLVRVVNKTGSTISNGSVVALSGAQGQRPKAVLASADTEALAHATIGVATQQILDNGAGFVTLHGLVRGLNTSAFTDGDVLYLDMITPGGIVSTPPAGHVVKVGMVVNAAGGAAGSIFVSVETGADLSGLHDVELTDLTNGDSLVYDSTSQTWKNGASASGGIDIQDVWAQIPNF